MKLPNPISLLKPFQGLTLLALSALASGPVLQAQVPENGREEFFLEVDGWAIKKFAAQELCGMVSSFDGPGNPRLILFIMENSSTLIYENALWTHRTERDVDMTLIFDDKRSYTPPMARTVVGEGDGIGAVQAYLTPELREEFANSNSLNIESQGRLIGAFDLDGTRDAIIMTQVCHDTIKLEQAEKRAEAQEIARFDLDPFAPGPSVINPKLREPPTLVQKIQDATGKLHAERIQEAQRLSYRPRSMDNIYANVSLAVDVHGVPTKCDITESSGDIPFDRLICRILKSEARFDPALDSDSMPTEGVWATTVLYGEKK